MDESTADADEKPEWQKPDSMDFPYQDDNGTWHVEALRINTAQFCFICPCCWSRYKKNGERALNSTKGKHYHGSIGDVSNRIEQRMTHCEKVKNGIFIHITDNTKKDPRERNKYGDVVGVVVQH